MGVLTDFVVAKRELAEAVTRSSDPCGDFPGIYAKGTDHTMLADLFAILSDHPHDPIALVAQRTPNGPWVHEVSETLVSLLAALEPKQITDVASAWAETEEFGFDDWSLDDVRQRLAEFAELCRLALTRGESVLMWTSL